MDCIYCHQNIEAVSKIHEDSGHNITCELRYDLVQDDKMCEDCRDDVLENMK